MQTPEADEQPKMGRIVQLAMFAIVVVAAVVRSCVND
jgi:hypothetical protein